MAEEPLNNLDDSSTFSVNEILNHTITLIGLLDEASDEEDAREFSAIDDKEPDNVVSSSDIRSPFVDHERHRKLSLGQPSPQNNSGLPIEQRDSPQHTPNKSNELIIAAFSSPKYQSPREQVASNESFEEYSQINYQEQHAPDPPRELEKLTINKHEYSILKEIGNGSSGKVFQVLSHTYGEIFALKWIEVKRPEDKQTVMNEIVLLKSLKEQDNIVRLLDYHSSQFVIYMIMEYGEIDLASLIKNQLSRKWDSTFIRYYWKQMLQAVYVIHQHKIVHSDLKPANFVVVQGNLKLIDFGIAMKFSDDTTNIHRGFQAGTINYMAPEALLDLNEGTGNGSALMKVGRPSDVWSLGCILYEMVYGNTPFYNVQSNKKMICISNNDYDIPFPSFILSEGNHTTIPQSLINLLRRCLDRNPSLRPNISELLTDSFVNNH